MRTEDGLEEPEKGLLKKKKKSINVCVQELEIRAGGYYRVDRDKWRNFLVGASHYTYVFPSPST